MGRDRETESAICRMFIPPDAIDYMADVFEIMSEAGYFIENQMAHVLKTMDFHNNQWAVEKYIICLDQRNDF